MEFGGGGGSLFTCFVYEQKYNMQDYNNRLASKRFLSESFFEIVLVILVLGILSEFLKRTSKYIVRVW